MLPISKPIEQKLVFVSSDESLSQTFRQLSAAVPGFRLVRKNDARTVLRLLQEDAGDIGVIVFHLTQSSIEWAEVALRAIASAGRSIPVWIVSDDAELNDARALALLKAGATEFFMRPLETRRLRYLMETVQFQSRQRARDVARSSAPQSESRQIQMETGSTFACHSPGMAKLVRRMRRVAPEEISVLITGETGSGKTHTALVLHRMSPRRDQPFVSVNCAALPENLIESELFGHRRGAFTGADSDHAGRFAAAGDGTILLDEIDSLPLAAQAKLLHAVDSRTYTPVGSTETKQLRARILIATNADLAAEAAAGRFRQDLYYRLNVAELHLPPLRERREEIRELVNEYVGDWAARHDGFTPAVSNEAWAALEAYDWPGNIRELRNVIERSLVFCDSDELTLDDLPSNVRQAVARPVEPTTDTANLPARDLTPTSVLNSETVASPSSNPLQRARHEAERHHLRQTLAQHGNNRSQAARALGISRPGLYKKLHQFGLL